MNNKRIRLPKEGLVSPEKRIRHDDFIDGTDVEGHSWTNPAQPVDFSKGTPTHGGEYGPGESATEPEAQ